MPDKIAIIGDFDPQHEPHRATNDSFRHAVDALGIEAQADWVPTPQVDLGWLARSGEYGGFWIAPGSPYRSMPGMLAAIRHARENRIPAFGNCGGFQHMVIEFARNVVGLKDADHAESNPEASRLVIAKLACSLVGQVLEVELGDGIARRAYGKQRVEERYYCRFGVNPEFVPDLVRAGLRISGKDPQGEMRIMELPDHPFFLGTLFVPQVLSTPETPHPLVMAFLKASLSGVLP